MSYKTLNDYCEFIVDCLHKTAPIEDSDTGYYSIRTPDIGRGRLNIEQANRVSKETFEKWTIRGIPQAGDLILAREAPVGNVGIVPKGAKVCCGQRTVHIRPNRSKIIPEYLVYLLNGDEVQAKIQGYSQGATVAHLNMEDIRALVLPDLPSLPIQRKIADVLSAYDDLIEVNTRRIRILEQMAQSVYREWFGKVDGKSLPEGWQLGIIRDICESYSYGYTAKAQAEPVGPKYLRITDIVPEHIDWDDVPYCAIEKKDIEKYLLREGDIVVARTGATTGYAKRLGTKHPKSVFASYLVRFRANKYFSHYLLGIIVEGSEYKQFIKTNLSGAAQPMANAQVLTSYPIIIPPKELLNKFDEQIKPLFALKEVLQKKNTNLRRTRDLLLPRLVSGDVMVS